MTPIVEYQNDKAVRVKFKLEGAHKELNVYRLKNTNIPILGSFSKENGYISFTPVLPFSTGQEFGIAHKGKQIARFKVESKERTKVPELLAIYPRQDTVPVNLLKMYLEFSEPMQHVGNPLDFITVFDKTEQTEVHPFLDLEAELWNADHTRLTLWFDPGRIKTDLIPNKEKGLPLKQKHTYDIIIDKNWKSAYGVPFEESYSKTIHVIGKDLESPNPENWTIVAPQKETKDALTIYFNEALDPILALESIKLFDGDKPLSGNLNLVKKDNAILFEPSHLWEAGDYRILIHPILEDLAGNNLKNLFDSDIRHQNAKKEIQTVLEFSIQ